MMAFDKKLILGAFVVCSLTMIGASADQAQAKGGCAAKFEKGIPCGNRGEGVGRHAPVYNSVIKKFVKPGGHPSKGRGGSFNQQITRCDALNSIRLDNAQEIVRCPNETLAQTKARYGID